MKNIKLMKAAIVVAALLVPLGAQAITPADAFTSLADAITTAIGGIAKNNPLGGLGWTILGFLAAANVVWLLIKGYFSGTGLNGVLADLVPLGISGAIAAAFLGGAGTMSLITAVEGSINVVGQAITGAPMGSVSDLLVSAAATSLETIRNLLFTSPNTAKDLDFWTGVVQLISAIPSVFMAIIASIVATFLIMVALGIYMAHLVMSQITIEIAKVFAPLFIPFLIWRPTSWLFEGWLRFFIGAALLKIVGFMLLQVTNVMMQAVLALSQSVDAAPDGSLFNTPVFDITKYGVIILMSGIGALLMSKAPSIATGLLSGSGGIGFSGWSELASKSPSTRMIMGGMGDGKSTGAGAGAQKAAGANAASGVTNMMPNFMKPATNAIGAMSSSIGGRAAAAADASTAKNMGDGTKNISRDLTQMSAATQRAYVSHLESRNARSAAQASSPGFYGPPSPRITVTKPVSSISRSDK